MKARRVVVLGAGLAGLTSALQLVAAGHEVTVVDREPVPGGRIGLQIEHGQAGSYRLDIGPSAFGARGLLEECFALVGRSAEEFLDFLPVTDGLRAHFPDGSSLLVTDDRSELLIEVGSLCGGDEAEGLARFLDDATAAVQHLRPALDQGGSPQAAARLAQARVLLARAQPRIERYVTDERLRRLYSFSPVSADTSGPLGLLALYTDLLSPSWFPKGGMYRLPAAMAVAAAEAGVTFRYGTDITDGRSTTRGPTRRLTALVTDQGEEIPCDAAVLTCGPALVRHLLGLRERRVHYAPSCLLLGFGGRWRIPEGATHRSVLFGRLGPSDDLAAGRLPSDPTMFVSMPTLTDPTLAPAGRQVATVITPTPNLGRYGPVGASPAPLVSSQDWGRIGAHYRQHVTARLALQGYHFEVADFADASVTLTPVDWLARGQEGGTPFGTTGLQTWWRPNRQAENVVVAGGAVGPGTGIGQAILSGMLAADRISGSDRPRPAFS